MKLTRICFALSIMLYMLLSSCSNQRADVSSDTTVAKPAFAATHPKVLFDEAHNNSSTTDGLYEPFANILKNDGYKVDVNDDVIEPEVLSNYDVLIIVNAKGNKHKFDPAFTSKEETNIYNWVNKGGSLLLIADHYPFGSAAAGLSEKFGVRMNKGEVYDSLNYDTTSSDKAQLVFSDINGLLPQSPIKNGRNEKERVHRVITFTGQSLFVVDTSSIVLKLSKTAKDIIPDSTWEKKSYIFFTITYTRFSDPMPSRGNAQCVALKVGNGRVVILGEAAVLTAQIVEDIKFGINDNLNDNKKFALNIMHWLSKIL
ncbi:MAG: DUF4350 domain-containing protein [Bacteroidetes bacterium]|nr:DUF4350 domain-containing protein [Bacteroidota bacterium]